MNLVDEVQSMVVIQQTVSVEKARIHPKHDFSCCVFRSCVGRVSSLLLKDVHGHSGLFYKQLLISSLSGWRGLAPDSGAITRHPGPPLPPAQVHGRTQEVPTSRHVSSKHFSPTFDFYWFVSEMLCL